MTLDTRFQLKQALREIPFNDWHPIAMTWTWQWLIDLTGQVGSMLFLQVVAAWVCAVLTSYYLLKVSRRGWSALAGLFILFMPNTVNIAGVVWKDVHLGLAMYFAVILMLLVRIAPRLRWVLAALAFGALVYAGLVRKNSAVAVVPVIAVMAVWVLAAEVRSRRGGEARWKPFNRRKAAVTAVAAIAGFGVIIGADSALTAALKPTKNSQYTQVLLDDLIFAVPKSAIESADAPQEEKDRLVRAKNTCEQKNEKLRRQGSAEIIWDAYWKCYGRGVEGGFTAIENPEAVASIWKQTVPKHFGAYIDYRVRTTTTFLFTSRLHFVPDNNEKYPAQSPQLRSSLQVYVLDFGVKTLPWLYLGGAALVLSGIGIVRSLGKRRRSFGAFAVFSSGVLYLMTYFPTAPAQDYRYVFWPWLATMIGWLVLWSERERRRNVIRS